MIKNIIALLILSVGISAQAQTRLIGDGPTDIMYREGVATYSDNNGMVATSWFSLRSKTNGDSGKWLIQVHCDSQLIRTIRYITYYNGNVVKNVSENWNSVWGNPVPGTFETLFQQICYSR